MLHSMYLMCECEPTNQIHTYFPLEHHHAQAQHTTHIDIHRPHTLPLVNCEMLAEFCPRTKWQVHFVHNAEFVSSNMKHAFNYLAKKIITISQLMHIPSFTELSFPATLRILWLTKVSRHFCSDIFLAEIVKCKIKKMTQCRVKLQTLETCSHVPPLSTTGGVEVSIAHSGG